MQIEISTLFSTIVAIVGLYATFHKINGDLKKAQEAQIKRAEENKEKQTERHVEIKMGQDMINANLQHIGRKIEEMDGKLERLDRRVTVVEESTKSAHKRIDTAIAQKA